MTHASLIAPHGGTLVNRVVDPQTAPEAIAAARRHKALRLNAVQHSDLVCIATGVFSPLTGFVGRADYESIVDRMRLASGTVWSIPVTLAVTRDEADDIADGSSIALLDPDGEIAGTMDVVERYQYDKQREATQVYRKEIGRAHV